MKVISLIKFIPDVSNFKYDYEKNILVRENENLIINPEDALALAFALGLKKKRSDVEIEVVAMAPESMKHNMEDLLRRGVDNATLIADNQYRGSDTYVTAKILAKYLEKREFQIIVCGSHSQDGSTGHIPSQVAKALNINQMTNILTVDENLLTDTKAVVEVDFETKILRFQLEFPSVLGFHKESKYYLPFVKYENLELDVKDRLQIINNEYLKLNQEEIGLKGSPTQVVKTQIKKMEKPTNKVVTTDKAGIEEVYNFLKKKGYL